MTVEFAVEKLVDFLPDVLALAPHHYEEVGVKRPGVHLDIDWKRYLELDDSGMLLCVTARSGGVLVGYHTYLVHRPLRYRMSMFAESDVYFLLPEYRGGMNGMRLLTFGERPLKDMGVQIVIIRSKLERAGIEADKQDIGPLFDALGYKAIERVYTKSL